MFSRHKKYMYNLYLIFLFNKYILTWSPTFFKKKKVYAKNNTNYLLFVQQRIFTHDQVTILTFSFSLHLLLMWFQS